MKRIQKYIKHNPQQVGVAALAFFLLAGFLQAAFGLDYVLALTPIVLTVAVCAAVIFWDAPIKPKLWASAIVLLGSFIVEVIGVQTGLLFGNYTYGRLLGFTVFGVPVTIGVTWLLVSLSAWHIAALNNRSLLQKFILGGALVVMFDLLLEQFASAYGLWAWQGGVIPLYNYLCWFGVSLLWFFVFYKLTPKSQPSFFVICLLPLMATFFWLMLIIS